MPWSAGPRATRGSAIAYGFLIWWIWFGFLGIAQLFPDSITSARSFATLRLLVLVLLVVFFAVDYLKRIEQGSVREGIVVGYHVGPPHGRERHRAFPVHGATDIGGYLTTFAPLYAWIPVATTIVFGRLQARAERAS